MALVAGPLKKEHFLRFPLLKLELNLTAEFLLKFSPNIFSIFEVWQFNVFEFLLKPLNYLLGRSIV